MIKGIHHRIIEVSDTGNPYFERALLFVKEDYTDHTAEELSACARHYTKQASAYGALREARAMRWFKRCVLVLVGAIGGTGLGIWLSFLE